MYFSKSDRWLDGWREEGRGGRIVEERSVMIIFGERNKIVQKNKPLVRWKQLLTASAKIIVGCGYIVG